MGLAKIKPDLVKIKSLTKYHGRVHTSQQWETLFRGCYGSGNPQPRKKPSQYEPPTQYVKKMHTTVPKSSGSGSNTQRKYNAHATVPINKPTSTKT